MMSTLTWKFGVIEVHVLIHKIEIGMQIENNLELYHPRRETIYDEVYPMHSVSFSKLHSGGDDDDACPMGG